MTGEERGMYDGDRMPVGNAPCSWGLLEFEEFSSRPIGYEQMLDELVETGYTGTELGDWAFMPTDPDQLRSELKRRKLTMLGAFVPVAFGDADAHADGEMRALRVARLLARVSDVGDPRHDPFVVLADDNGKDRTRTLNAGRCTPDMMLEEADWLTFAAGVERIALAVLEETGIPTVFHPHCAGFVEAPEEIDNLMKHTDPALVGLVFDTGHYAFGSGGCENVAEGISRFSDRIQYIHFKDCDGEVADRSRIDRWDYFTSLKHGIFCELGQGCVDFPNVTACLRGIGYRGWIVVEQDVLPGMGEPRESAERNRRFLHELGL